MTSWGVWWMALLAAAAEEAFGRQVGRNVQRARPRPPLFTAINDTLSQFGTPPTPLHPQPRCCR